MPNRKLQIFRVFLDGCHAGNGVIKTKLIAKDRLM